MMVMKKRAAAGPSVDCCLLRGRLHFKFVKLKNELQPIKKVSEEADGEQLIHIRVGLLSDSLHLTRRNRA